MISNTNTILECIKNIFCHPIHHLALDIYHAGSQVKQSGQTIRASCQSKSGQVLWYIWPYHNKCHSNEKDYEKCILGKPNSTYAHGNQPDIFYWRLPLVLMSAGVLSFGNPITSGPWWSCPKVILFQGQPWPTPPSNWWGHIWGWRRGFFRNNRWRTFCAMLICCWGESMKRGWYPMNVSLTSEVHTMAMYDNLGMFLWLWGIL